MTDKDRIDLTASMASFSRIPVTQRIPDEFEYRYGEAQDGESSDFILLRDQEGSSVFDEYPPPSMRWLPAESSHRVNDENFDR